MATNFSILTWRTFEGCVLYTSDNAVIFNNFSPYDKVMNQRSTFSRTKEPRREKIIRTRRDDDERFPDEPPSRRSSSERPSSSHGSSFSRFKDGYSEKSRSNSRDTPGSLVFRRQERGKLQANFSKNSAEVSPGRIPHSDSMKNDTPSRCNYISHYNRGTSNRDYTSKRSGKISALQ